MRLLTTVLINLVLASLAFAQTVPAIPWDSAVLTWTAPTEYAAGGTLADPVDIAYIVEVSGPGGNGWGPVAIVRGVTTYRFDNLSPGLWSFRIKTLINGAAFSLASNVGTKNIVAPVTVPPVVSGFTAK